MSNLTQNATFNISDNATCIINQSTESHSGFFYAVMWYLATIVIKLDQITNALAVTKDKQDKAMDDEVKTENVTVTAQLNTDIHGYLAGNNSFITGLVDLLLARMAKEERFSESEFFSSEEIRVNDVVVFESEYDNRTCYGLVDAVADSNWAATAWIGRVMEYIDGEWCHRRSKIFDLEEISIRPINELEAVEFRKAMEAVYG